MTDALLTDTFDYLLPSLGADMDAGRVIEWRVAPGDTVHRGDILASVETEKSDIDIEIWSDGIVEEFLVELNAEIPVGTPVMRLRRTGDAAPAPASALPSVPPSASAGGVFASPLARRLAAERSIDLATVTGSGPNGAVVRADLDAIGSPRPMRNDSMRSDSMRNGSMRSGSMRAVIAERMARANREIPHYFLDKQVDAEALQRWLAEQNEGRPIAERLLPAAAYVRAVALAAERHPELNGFWTDDGFEPGEAVNVAMAISLRRGGLVTPHVADAGSRTVHEIMAALTELVAASRTGALRSSWMTGATITITNLGDHGADLVHGVISPPQVALVGFGGTVERPWVVDGDVVVRPIVTVTLAADHRATDGATGSRFLATLAHLLEHPQTL